MTLAVAGRGALLREPSQFSRCYLTLYYQQHAESAVYPFSHHAGAATSPTTPFPLFVPPLSFAAGSAALAPRTPRGGSASLRVAQLFAGSGPGAAQYFEYGGAGGVRGSRGGCWPLPPTPPSLPPSDSPVPP